jgi:hypothetical protein
MAAFMAPTAPQCPGGGGSTLATNSFSASAGAKAGWGGAEVSAQVSNNSTSGMTCPTNTENTTIQTNKAQNLTTIDNSVMIMNKNSLESISTSVNQMIVNSITNTTSSSSQNVNIQQKLNLKISGVKGNVTVDNINQTATIDLSNAINSDMSVINNVRTDLSNGIIQQFQNSTQAEQMSQASTDVENEIENMTASSVKQKNEINQEQTQQSDIPIAAPPPLQAPNNNSNIKNRSETSNDLTTSLVVGSPFNLTNSVERTIRTNIENSVTQNFTQNTVTQLMQAINLSQEMNIDLSSIAGNVVVSNLSQVANVQLRQVLSQKMDIGTAIVNQIKNDTGIKTDDEVAVKKTDIASMKNANGLRNSNTFSSDQDQSVSQKTSVTSGYGSMGSMGSIVMSCVCCIILCVAAPMLGGMMPAPAEEETSEASTSSDEPPSEAAASEASTEAPASPDAVATPASSEASGTSVGGYY